MKARLLILLLSRLDQTAFLSYRFNSCHTNEGQRECREGFQRLRVRWAYLCCGHNLGSSHGLDFFLQQQHHKITTKTTMKTIEAPNPTEYGTLSETVSTIFLDDCTRAGGLYVCVIWTLDVDMLAPVASDNMKFRSREVRGLMTRVRVYGKRRTHAQKSA